MAINIKKTSGGTRIDAESYEAQIVKVTVGQGDNGDYLKWDIKILHPKVEGDVQAEPVVIGYLTGFKLTSHSKNKLNNLLKAAGIDAALGEVTDVEVAIGQRVKVFVADKETDQGIFSQITDVLPSKRPAAAQAAQRPAATQAKPAPVPAAQQRPIQKPQPKPPVAEEEYEDEDAPVVETTPVSADAELDDLADLENL
jgi:hypothetical protein